MFTPAELAEAKKRQTAEKELSIGLDPENSPRISKALNAVYEYLNGDSNWTPWALVITRMVYMSGIEKKTAEGQLRRLVRARYVEVRGEFTKRGMPQGGVDNREVRLIYWPTDD